MNSEEILTAIAADPALIALAAVRNDTAIAEALSVGRTKPTPTEIGSGTVLATLGAIGISGGVFLDTLVSIGAQNRDVYWTMDLIKQGRLRIDLPATRDGLESIGAAVPSLLPAVAALLQLGSADDPIPVDAVSAALNGGI